MCNISNKIPKKNETPYFNPLSALGRNHLAPIRGMPLHANKTKDMIQLILERFSNSIINLFLNQPNQLTAKCFNPDCTKNNHKTADKKENSRIMKRNGSNSIKTSREEVNPIPKDANQQSKINLYYCSNMQRLQ